MSLVTYSDSDDSPPPNPRPSRDKPTKRKREISPGSALPSLPASFHNLYATKARTSTSDDPALHDGRQRGTPHKPGNWPSHIYIEWIPSANEVTALESIIQQFGRAQADSVHSFLHSELGSPLPLHVSLSQSLDLTSDQREAFTARLRLELSHTAVRSTTVRPLYPKWASNFSETRHFLVLPLDESGEHNLSKLLEACNTTAKAFGLPLLYSTNADASNEGTSQTHFHISIAWSLKRVDDKGHKAGTSTDGLSSIALRTESSTLHDSSLDQIKIPVNAVKAKIGNSIVEVALNRLSKSTS